MTGDIVRVSARVPLAQAEEAARRARARPRRLRGARGRRQPDARALRRRERGRGDSSGVRRCRRRPVEPGWEDAWRAFHRPARAGGLWIGPPWEQTDAGEPAVVIDPGRAFGTAPTRRRGSASSCSRGPSEARCSTSAAARACSRSRPRASASSPIQAVDNDPVAVETTIANAAVNGVSIEARVLDGESDELPAADVAVANVLLAPVERILARLDARFAITSGYLAADLPGRPAGGRRTARARRLGGRPVRARAVTRQCAGARPR